MKIDSIQTHAANRPQALACIDLATNRQWEYAKLHSQINQVANWLIATLGTHSAERIGVISKNCVEMIIINIACVRAGKIFVPINFRLSVREIAVLLEDCEASLVFYDASLEHLDVGSEWLDIASLLALVENFETTMIEQRHREFEEVSTILYTSGTSGVPKGVMLSEQNAFWSQYNFNTSNQVSSKSIFLCDMPLFHTAGLLANTRAPLLAGGCVLISSGFDVQRSIEYLSNPSYKITHYFCAAQMAQMMWNHPCFDATKMQHLVVLATGGSPNPKVQIERFLGANIPMADGFGMSETGSTTIMPISNPALVLEKAGSCGLPFISIELKIVDDHDNELENNQAGELWVKGPSVTKGYWNKPKLSKDAFSPDGWFKTGDVAKRDDDGFYFLLERKKDMFISGGENIYPNEIESCIIELEQIAEVAVIGVDDEQWGEVGLAFVVVREGHTISIQDITAHCISTIAKYKVPKTIKIVSTIPRTSSGKVQKHLLKSE